MLMKLEMNMDPTAAPQPHRNERRTAKIGTETKISRLRHAQSVVLDTVIHSFPDDRDSKEYIEQYPYGTHPNFLENI